MIITLNGRDIKLKPFMEVGKYQQIIKQLELVSKDPTKLLSLYLDCDINELRDLPKNEVDFIEQFISSVMLQPPKQELTYTFQFNGITYGLENDWKKLAWGAWQDFEILSAENINDNIHYLLAILYRPTTKINKKDYKIVPYKSAEIKDRAELFKQLPIEYWFGVSSFFLLIGKLYITDINNSLMWTTKTNQLTTKLWMKLPTCLRNKLPLDSILLSPYPYAKKTLLKSNK